MLQNSQTPSSSSEGRLLSLHTGRIREMLANTGTDGREVRWASGIFKAAVTGLVQVTTAGIQGDEQADLENHGGPDNVVLAYDGEHYAYWRQRLHGAGPELTYGAFGENFAVSGFAEDTVCIGDVWLVGADLRLQVTQARQPCYKLARRLERPEIIKLVWENSWGGWYLRVLQPGTAEAGMAIQRVERRHPAWTVARAVQTMYARKQHPQPARELATLPELSARWKRELLEE